MNVQRDGDSNPRPSTILPKKTEAISIRLTIDWIREGQVSDHTVWSWARERLEALGTLGSDLNAVEVLAFFNNGRVTRTPSL